MHRVYPLMHWVIFMFQRWKQSFFRFMYGRYGTDQLNNVLLIIGIVLTVLGWFSSMAFLTFLSYIPLVLVIYRMFSRDVNRRRKENQKFMQFFNRLQDRDSRYFSCPRCHQTVRVPRHRGKINIHCPKCGNQFIKKT